MASRARILLDRVKSKIVYYFIIVKFFFVSLVNPETKMPNAVGGQSLGGRGGPRQRPQGSNGTSIPFACGPGG